MKPGYTFSVGEFDSEILRSGDFQLISITLDSTAKYAAAGFGSGVTKIPKGVLLTLDSDLSDGVYNVVDTEAGNNQINGTPTQFMRNAVVLAETILDASAGDQQVKAYWAGTFNWTKLKYNYSATTALTMAQLRDCQRLTIVDGPTT
uniref:Uncharacterized protein n=1 Tax=viral metagenome TaxID=1070528 RepID=A0A6M3KU48_9ZZZZ